MPNSSHELSALADQVLQPGFRGGATPDWILRHLGGGGASVLHFGPGVPLELTARLRAENPEVVIALDEEGGDITRLEATTGSSFPGNLALGTVDDTVLTSAVAGAIGEALANVGVNLDYAPDADVNSNPDNPVIGVRSFGADPDLVARHTAAWIRGLQSSGVAACAKHFPGHGDTAADSHFALPTVSKTTDELAAVALPPFRAAIDAGVRAIMTAHLLAPDLDPDHPATVSPRILNGLLRGELGFDGMIVSDAIQMHAVARRYGVVEAAVRALAAGVDLVCLGDGSEGSAESDFLAMRKAIVDAVATGALPEKRLVEAATKVTEFSAWCRSLSRREANQEDDIGLAAARRALQVSVPASVSAPAAATATARSTRGVLPLERAPHVVELSTATTQAIVQSTRWGLATALAHLLPETTSTRLPITPFDGTEAESLLAEAVDRPLVLVVRNAHRWPDAALWFRELIARRPDAVVVEMGLPGRNPGAAAYLTTCGSAKVCAQAAAEALTARRLSERRPPERRPSEH
jgi:beta-N-acetylhexosaminidase